MSDCVNYDIAVHCALVQSIAIERFFARDAGPGYLRVVAVMEPVTKHICDQCAPWYDVIYSHQRIARAILALSTPS